ncbi:helicase-related protein [Acidisphaera sp. L21]|uniref:helicase-related protein n=1 Tax=Acidisphaera sp. L21 TaxID=1641851 RepID=UPI00131B253B|nr:helicase-related protein [Acidisphaera sp. L21]
MSGFPSRVKAVLGPTNTGKTHLAIERLLAHSSGTIGFPLRLLARENYDRMVARKGAKFVALITGEEKIIPPDARWFSCTVEAMPLDRPAEFVAVDEIQLCADADRGHIFTDRLLHARGLVETMFLGAETIRPLLQRLVPQAEITTRPRLSQLTFAGPEKLVRLPPRSAVVAFSAEEVYAIAELIRRRRGGCAVVMGRLSPRTRNAQVALYQDKEVDFLVATDAIGMGLNMDVDHVAFARLGKFDGHRPRRLTASEVAQIAGRAGRGMRDGTFGTTGGCAPIDPELAEAVQDHRFEPLEQLAWRNSTLDFSHVDGLLASLQAPPPRAGLMRGRDASDLETLATLARDRAVRDLATSRRMVRILWDACQIPDFRKLADDSHARFCARVFDSLARDGHLPADWLDGQVAQLDRADGDIDTLMQRLSGVRVWSYIAARPDWVRDAVGMQDRARAVEDKLSDALHEKLTARFVDRRSTLLIRRLENTEGEALLSAVTPRGEVVVEGHSVGMVEGFGFTPDPAAVGEEKRLVLRAARRALRQEMPRRVEALAADADAGFTLAPDGRITWSHGAVARLRPGAGLLHPLVEVADSEYLDGPQRERIRVRLQALATSIIEAELGAVLRLTDSADPALRGPLHQLGEAGGVAPALLLPPPERARLKALGVRAGRFGLFHPAALKPRAMALRALLWSVAHRVPPPAVPAAGLVSLPAPADWPPGFAAAMGWFDAGPVLLRLDVAERIAAELAYATRRGATALLPNLASRLSIRAELLPGVLRSLGARVVPATVMGPEAFGPPAPPMLAASAGRARGRSHRAPPAPVPVRIDSPFAALAALRQHP